MKKVLIINKAKAPTKPPITVPITLAIPFSMESTTVFCMQITAAIQANIEFPLLISSNNNKHKKTESDVLIFRIPIFIMDY